MLHPGHNRVEANTLEAMAPTTLTAMMTGKCSTRQVGSWIIGQPHAEKQQGNDMGSTLSDVVDKNRSTAESNA